MEEKCVCEEKDKLKAEAKSWKESFETKKVELGEVYEKLEDQKEEISRLRTETVKKS